VKKLISERVTANGLLVLLSLVVGFHLLVLTGVIPYQIVWGGRLKTQEQMLRFEVVSVLLNLLMLAVVGVKARVLKWAIPPVIIKVGLWVMGGLFLANTVGNLFSTNEFEKLVFTPLTLLLALFSLRLAMSKWGAGLERN
jgi:hypothetical protein